MFSFSLCARPARSLRPPFAGRALPRLAARGAPPPPNEGAFWPFGDVPANGVDVAESFVVEVIQGLRLENRHVDVAFPEDIVERFLLAVVGIGVPVPHIFLRAQGFRVVIEAIDPTLGEVGPQPILLRRVPNVEVVVDDEQVLLLSIRRLGSDHEESPLTLGRMNGLARLKPILADGGQREEVTVASRRWHCPAHASLPTGAPNRRRVISPSSSLARRAGGDRMDSPQTEGDATSGNGMSGGIGPTGWRAWSLEQVLILGGVVSMVLAVLILVTADPAFPLALAGVLSPGIVFTGLPASPPRPG